MTAVAGFLVNDIPCLLGDALLVRTNTIKDGEERPGISLPLTGRQTSEMEIWWDTKVATGLTQKVVKIGDHAVIAWSGLAIDASRVVKAMRQLYGEIDPTDYTQLRNLLNIPDVLEIKPDQTSFILALANEERWSLKSFGEVSNFTTPMGENACATGAAADAVIDVFDSDTFHNHDHKFSQALGIAMMASGRMWYQDRTGLGPLNTAGGGYEVAIRQNNKFTKIGEVLHAYVSVQRHGSISIGHTVGKVDYIDDLLILRALELGGEANPTAEARIAVVPPVDRAWNEPPSSAELDKITERLPSLNPKHLVTYVEIEAQDPTKPNHSTVLHRYCGENDSPIQFLYKDKAMHPYAMLWHQSYLEQIANEAKEMWQYVANGGT